MEATMRKQIVHLAKWVIDRWGADLKCVRIIYTKRMPIVINDEADPDLSALIRDVEANTNREVE